MYFDGALNLDRAGAEVLFISSKGKQLNYALQLLFKATNNATKYNALIHGLQITASLGIKRLLSYGDSKVVIYRSTKTGTAHRRKWMLTARRYRS
jgi:ribonuclease HI